MSNGVKMQTAIEFHQRRHDANICSLRNAIKHLSVYLADVDVDACDSTAMLRIARRLKEHSDHMERVHSATRVSRGVLHALREIE